MKRFEIVHGNNGQRLQSTGAFPFKFLAELVLAFALECGVSNSFKVQEIKNEK